MRNYNYKNISPQEAKKMLDNKKNIVLLDVRSENEYNESHILNSILIPLDILKDEIKSIVKDINTTIFIYCKSGIRSALASEMLIELGYINVYNLGGIIDWPYEKS